jgi:uncharacterized protein (TIGR02757 family)
MPNRLGHQDLQDLLDQAYHAYARPEFAEHDPVRIPRSLRKREDAEVAGLLTATLAWGQRVTILRKAMHLLELMDNEPHTFCMHATAKDLGRLDHFVHRTFNGADARQFVLCIRHLYDRYGGMEQAFLYQGELGDMGQAISRFRARFFELVHLARARKHMADPASGSHAKRMNLFLRWMVRPNDRGIDLGLWKRISAASLHVPLDVHTGRVARQLGLLQRNQDDHKSVLELTQKLREFDAVDPVRYDIALFSLGTHRALAKGGR